MAFGKHRREMALSSRRSRVDVIALVNRNDIVFVIHAVSDDATRRWEQPIAQACSTSRSSMSTSARLSSSPWTRRVRQRLPKGHADLADQLRRAAQSVPQNIAEGCGRTTRADKAKHYTIARGSAMECASHFDVMRVDELIDAELYAQANELLERIVAMLTKLIDA